MATETHLHLVSGYFRSGKSTFIKEFLVPLYNPHVVVLEDILDDIPKAEKSPSSVDFASKQNPFALVRNLRQEGLRNEQIELQFNQWILGEYVGRISAALGMHEHVVGENHALQTLAPQDRMGMVEKLRATGKVASINAYYMDADLPGCFRRMVEKDMGMNPGIARRATLPEFERMMQNVKPTLAEANVYDSLFTVKGTPGHCNEWEVSVKPTQI